MGPLPFLSPADAPEKKERGLDVAVARVSVVAAAA